MSSDGYILTNRHVIEDADQIVIALQNGAISTNVKLVGDDSLTDLAVLKIEVRIYLLFHKIRSANYKLAMWCWQLVIL